MNTLLAMSTLVLSGGQVILGLFATGVAIYLGIFASKTYLYQQSSKIRGEQASDNSSALVRKYEGVDIQKHAKNIKLAGLSTALAIVFIVFAWTQFTSDRVLAEFVYDVNDIEMEIPVTPREKPAVPPALPPPVSKPSIDIKIVDEPEPIEEPKLESKVVSPTPSNYTGPTDENSTELPIIIEKAPEEVPVVDVLPFIIVEQMPRFPGCEDMKGDNSSKKICADQKMLSYVYDHIKYPEIAREMGIEGMVVVSFIVDKDGTIIDMEIKRDPGGGCGKEAVRVIRLMNKMSQKWTPGKQRGKAVQVRYNLPIRFRLNG
jgi:protein TonB